MAVQPSIPSAKQALESLEKSKFWPVYYLYGEEPFKIQEFLNKAQGLVFGEKISPDAIERVDGAQSSGSEVLEKLSSMSLFGMGAGGGKRFVIVRQAHQLKEIESLSKLIMESSSHEEPLWGETVLFFIAENLDGRRKFHQWMKKQGYAIEFKIARDAELLTWVQYLAKKQEAQIAPDAAEMLAVLSDGSLYRLSHEIEKAWLFAGAKKGTEITRHHVSAMSSAQMTHEMVELVRAILDGKRTRALLLCEKLLHTQEDALGLVGFLTWALRNPGKGFIGSQTVSFSMERTKKIIGSLVDLDLRLKSSGLDIHALVDEFVIENTKAPLVMS